MFKSSNRVTEVVQVEVEPSPEMLMVRVREYDEKGDKEAVERVEAQCDGFGGCKGKPTLVTDLLGDPISRVRQSPLHVMLIAEYGEEKGIVGMIMGSIKTVTRGENPAKIYVKVAYILGLRVLPSHRRLGLGTKLIQELESWCVERGAEYAYMATECTNKASINLFTNKCAYSIFRTPTMLVQPVHAHKKPLSSQISIIKLIPLLAESMYGHIFGSSEFFPKDISDILSNKLNLGTFMAIPKGEQCNFTTTFPSTFAILSVWNTKEVFKLQLKGLSGLKYAGCIASRKMDTWMQWMKIPSVPDLFTPFGVYFMYGLHAQGSGSSRLMKSLCGYVHNMGRNDKGCGAIVTEVGKWDPVRKGIPCWKRFSWAEDLWCMKKLGVVDGDCEEREDWVGSPSSTNVIFVDPRDF